MSAAARLLPFHNPSDTTGGDEWSGAPADMTGVVPPRAGETDAVYRLETGLRFDRLEIEMIELRGHVAKFAEATTVLVETLAPEALDLVRPFHVNLEPWEGGFRASFTDANLMGFGETGPEAVWDLKDLVAATFEALIAAGEPRLGPGPARQLAVLSQFIRR